MEIKFMKRRNVVGVRIVRHIPTNEMIAVCGRIRNLESYGLIECISGEDKPEHFMVIHADGTYNIESEWNTLVENVRKYYQCVSYIEWKERFNAFHLADNIKKGGEKYAIYES